MIARRLISALLIALTISGVFTFWLSRKVSAKPHAVAAPVEQKYVAAASNLEAGQVLTAASLKLIDWPATAPLDGAHVRVEDLAGRTVLFPLSAGEPVLDRQLATAGGSGLMAKIPEGMRAISLKSSEVIGVSGFLLPGSHIDVLGTFHVSSDNSNSPESQVTATILQDVEVLAAGQKTQPDPEGKPITVDVVTLLVKPSDAERATLAVSLGSVQFVLRNGNDHQQVTGASGVQVAQLAGGAGARPRAVAAPHAVKPTPQQDHYQVETVAGSKSTVEVFK